MMKQHFHIAELISRYISGTLSDAEKDELQQWRDASHANEQLFHKLCDSENFRAYYLESQKYDKDEAWGILSSKIQSFQRKKLLIKIGRYAAIIVLAFVVGIIAVQVLDDDNSVADQVKKQTVQILPGESKAILTLGDGQTVDLKAAGETTMTEKDGTAISIDSKTLNYASADNTNKPTINEVLYNKVEVPHGGEYSLTLSDGTKVYLNSLSSIKFPVHFNGDKREVELRGEAYFDVSPGNKPFVVNYNNVAVEVLGTQFNISAYPGEDSHATLVNGTVKVSTETGSTCILKPSEQAYIKPRTDELEVRQVNTALYTSWVNGKIYFKDERLEDIMNILSRWYDINVFYSQSSVKELRFGCNVNRYKEITPFLELLESTDKLQILISGKTITFKHNN